MMNLNKFPWCNTDTGLLVLRIGVGAIFIFSGWAKAADLQSTLGFFASMGFSAFWAYLVIAVELVGGIATLLGIYSRLATALLSIVMIVAIYESRASIGMAITPIAMLFSTLALTLSGSGKYSIEKKWNG